MMTSVRRPLLSLALLLSCATPRPLGAAPPPVSTKHLDFRADPFVELGEGIGADEARAYARLVAGPVSGEVLLRAALRASGVNDPARLAQLEKRARTAYEALAKKLPKEDRTAIGKKLLESMHGAVLRGYEAHQSAVDVLLETGVFNCVSSAILFNVFARWAGFDTGGLEWESHASAYVVVAGRRVTVETTTAGGFGKLMNEADHARFIEEFKLPKAPLGKPREVSDAVLVALVPMNVASREGNEATDEQSLRRRFNLWSRAAHLAPRYELCVRNRFVLAERLALVLFEKGELDRSLRVLGALLRHAPAPDKAASIRHNLVVVAARRLERVMQSGDPAAVGAAVDDAWKLLDCPSGTDCDKLARNLESGTWTGASQVQARPEVAWAAVSVVLDRMAALRGSQNHAYFAIQEAERRVAAGDVKGADALLEAEWARAGCPAKGVVACPGLANAGTVGTQADERRALAWARREVQASPEGESAKSNLRTALGRLLMTVLEQENCAEAKLLADERRALGPFDPALAQALENCGIE